MPGIENLAPSPDRTLDQQRVADARARLRGGSVGTWVCRPAAGVACAGGAKFSMPGMMDTVLNLGLNDESVEGRPSRRATTRSRWTPTAGSSRCSARSCWTCRRARSRTRSTRPRTPRASAPRHRPAADDLAGAGRRVQGHLPASTPARTSRRTRASSCGYAIEAVFKSLERQARARLPAQGQDPRRPRHRGERAGDGVRQQGRRLRHRRRVHARPRHRRAGAVRRLPANAQGEDVVAGHPQHAAARATGAARSRSPTRELIEVMATPREPLPRHVRHRVHDRAGPLWMLQTRVGKRTAPASGVHGGRHAATRA